jgi:hypothetical protein
VQTFNKGYLKSSANRIPKNHDCLSYIMLLCSSGMRFYLKRGYDGRTQLTPLWMLFYRTLCVSPYVAF